MNFTTDFYLIKDVVYGANYENVVDFDNKDLQRSYFSSRRLHGYETTARYIQSNSSEIIVNIPDNIVKLHKYMEYTVSSGDISKTYFCFIQDSVYVDPNKTRIRFTVDVWQTYLFDYEITSAFVEREHQDRFTMIDDNLEPVFSETNENIELGEQLQVTDIEEIKSPFTVEITNTQSDEYDGEEIEFYISYISSKGSNYRSNIYGINYPFILRLQARVKNDSNNTHRRNVFFKRDGVEEHTNITLETHSDKPVQLSDMTITTKKLLYPPFEYIITSVNEFSVTIKIKNNTTNLGDLFIEQTNIDGLDEDIVVIEKINSSFVDTKLKTLWITDDDFIVNPDLQKNIVNETKLYTKPFSDVLVKTGSTEGLVIDMKYCNGKELHYISGLDVEGKGRISVKNYLGDEHNELHFIDIPNMDDYPLVTDKYLSYILNQKASATTNMGVNIAQTVGGVAMTIGGFASGGLGVPVGFMGISMGLQGMSGIAQQVAKETDLQTSPSQIKNIGSDLLFNIHNKTDVIRIYKRSVRETYLQRAFEYMYRFGYTVKDIKIPNLRSRYYFNYVKTAMVEVVGNFNEVVRNQLSEIFNKGVTIWHNRLDNPELEVYNYNRENAEMSLL